MYKDIDSENILQMNRTTHGYDIWVEMGWVEFGNSF